MFAKVMLTTVVIKEIRVKVGRHVFEMLRFSSVDGILQHLHLYGAIKDPNHLTIHWLSITIKKRLIYMYISSISLSISKFLLRSRWIRDLSRKFFSQLVFSFEWWSFKNLSLGSDSNEYYHMEKWIFFYDENAHRQLSKIYRSRTFPLKTIQLPSFWVAIQ